MNNINMEKIAQFLGGTFHQDIDSIDEALEEVIEEINKEWIIDLINNSELFLNSGMSEDEKNKFIEENCDIYIPNNLTPSKWFDNIIERLKKEIEDK